MSKGIKNIDLSILSSQQRAAFFEKKLASYMGFAAKAGRIASGTNTCIFTMAKGKARLLIVADDMAENSKEKLVSAARQNEVEYRIFGHAEDLAHYTGRYGAGAFCVTDDNFAEVIAQAIDDTSK